MQEIISIQLALFIEAKVLLARDLCASVLFNFSLDSIFCSALCGTKMSID